MWSIQYSATVVLLRQLDLFCTVYTYNTAVPHFMNNEVFPLLVPGTSHIHSNRLS
jgi:hypothetical protein